MPNKKFLEEYPLYRKYDFEPRKHWNKFEIGELSKPTINMHCPVCKSNQTYNVSEYGDYKPHPNIFEDNIYRLQYVCTGCHSHIREFILRFREWIEDIVKKGEKETMYYLQVEKVGQYPSWSIESDEALEGLLDEHADYYKKGLICESQSYGIGAFAYFRRITEDIIDNLLDSIADLIELGKKEEYKKALEQVRETKITEDKINLVKELLPLSLKPEGMNPLKTLHSALSAGLHNETDEECMAQAEIIRNVLVFLVNQVLKTKKEAKKFADGIGKLLGNK